jgi:hypothetical protein
MFLIPTFAFGIDAPDESVTKPERVAPATWAESGVDQKAIRQNATTRHIIKPAAALILF